MIFGRSLVAGALLFLIACGRDGADAGPAPFSFLAITSDSTHWVHADREQLRVKRSAMLLALSDSTISELYVVDDDRSFVDALLVGQRIYRRNLVAGDSSVLFTDSTVVAAAARYARAHPDELPLGADDEIAESPSVVATTETDLLSVYGPFLNVELHVDEETNGVSDRHSTHRQVYDIRTGNRVPLATLTAGDTLRVLAAGRLQLSEFADSVNATTDVRALGARAAMAEMIFDPRSFSLVELDGQPAVQFFVPGVGEVAGGYVLPLAPVPIARSGWWDTAAVALPNERTSERRSWRGAYSVVAEADQDGTNSRLAVRRVNRRWTVGRFDGEIQQVIRLDRFAASSPMMRALGRAFDDAGYYSGDVRTAAYRRAMRCRRSPAKQCKPRPLGNQNRSSPTL